jgi:hypothetical protein
MRSINSKGWVLCAGQRLVSVHTEWGMPGLLSLGDLWNKPCDVPHTCGCPGTPPGSTNCSAYGKALDDDFAASLGPALAALKPAFANGSIAGISLGDELCADGVPVSNLSTVASFIKQQLVGTDMFIVTNEDTTSFGCKLHGEQCHFPGSFADFGSIPSAIDYISIDMYTGTSCLNTLPNGRCGYEINPADCILRECEADHVMPWYYLKVFPLLGPHQSAWIVPGE